MNRIVWATVAADDFREVFEYLSNQSQAAARTFVDQVDSAVKRLGTHPHSGRIVPELKKQNISRYREVVLNPWRVFYRYEQDTVYIVSLIDGRRNIEEILLRRVIDLGQ
jgi:addiction module RelE/StbE family toxin